MVRWISARFKHTSRRLGLLAAVVALAGQVALGAVVPAEIVPRLQLAALIAASVICHAPDAPGSGDRKSPHPLPDCALRCLNHVLARIGPTLAPPPVLLTPPSRLAMRVPWLPPARAPPLRLISTANARAPPVLS
jgi:hypothetical protein